MSIPTRIGQEAPDLKTPSSPSRITPTRALDDDGGQEDGTFAAAELQSLVEKAERGAELFATFAARASAAGGSTPKAPSIRRASTSDGDAFGNPRSDPGSRRPAPQLRRSVLSRVISPPRSPASSAEESPTGRALSPSGALAEAVGSRFTLQRRLSAPAMAQAATIAAAA